MHTQQKKRESINSILTCCKHCCKMQVKTHQQTTDKTVQTKLLSTSC